MHSNRRIWNRIERSLDLSHGVAALDGTTDGSWVITAVVMVLVAAACGVASVLVTGALADRPVFILALPLAVALVVWSIVGPAQLFLVLVLTRAALNPIFDIARLPVFGGLGALLNIVIIGLAVAMAVRGKYRVPSSVWKMWIPFLVVIAVGVVRAPELLQAERNAAIFLTFGAIYYIGFHLVRDEASLDRTLGWLLVSAIPVFVYTLVHDVALGRTPDGRFNGPFAHPNILGFYCVILLGAWLAKARSDPAAPMFNLRSIGWWIYAGGLGLLLAGTQSRGAWVGASIVFVAFALFVQRRYLLLLVVIAVIAATVPGIRDRLLDLTANNDVGTYSTLNSFAWREYLWRSALAVMSPMSYVIGNGIGAFVFESIRFFPIAGGVNWGAHNVYMQLLYDNGALGVISFLFLFCVPALALSKSRTLARPVRVTALALIPSFAFMCYGDNMLDYLVVNWNFWFVIGIAVSATQSKDATRDPSASAIRPDLRRPFATERLAGSKPGLGRVGAHGSEPT